MTTTTFFFIFIPLLAFILLAVNLIFAPHNPYQEKDSAFECGFHSFLGQNRTQFSISFFIFALLFLLFDLEILLVYPYVVSAYANEIYGLIVMLIFFLVLTLGFIFELGKNALKIDSRQMYSVWNKGTKVITFVSQKKIFNVNNLSYLNVFLRSCKTFRENLSLKVIVINIALRLVLISIVYYLITCQGWCIIQVWLVRILILQVIIVYLYKFYNVIIVNFVSNCTRKDIMFIFIYFVISIFSMLALYLMFISILNYIIIDFSLLFLIPGLNGSILRMDISKLLNPATPPNSSSNNTGNLGGGNSGGGSGGGGDGGSSSVSALGGNDSSNSNDDSRAHSAAPINYPVMDFFYHTPEVRREYINGQIHQLFFYNHRRASFFVLNSGLFHDKPLEVYWHSGRQYKLLRIEPARPMPYALSAEPRIGELFYLYVDKTSSVPEWGKYPYDASLNNDCGKKIYYKLQGRAYDGTTNVTYDRAFPFVETPYVTYKHMPLRLASYNKRW